ncbi:MAG: hypothetical protein ABIJ12_06445 [bacterium]
MKKVSALLLFFLIIINYLNCGPQKITEEVREKCIPSLIQIDANDGSMRVMFRENCKSLKSGYNIYISESSLSENSSDTIKPNNHPVFPGDTTPEDGIEQYEATGLENGKVYYVSIRTVFSDQTMSKPSEELKVVCGPRGEFDLSIRYKSDKDGFSFAKNGYVRADDIYNDLYLFTKDSTDFLASPSRLDGFLRTSKFRLLSTNNTIEEAIKKSISTNNPYDETINITKGSLVQVLTADGHTALLQVVGFSGEGESRQVILKYAFTIRTSVPFF